MKNCPNCQNQVGDASVFCTNCGYRFEASQQSAPYTQQPQSSTDPYDHTAEFDPKDVSDNKVISMLVYLLGAVGILIALLAANSSPYAAFHVRQALKFTVVNTLIWVIAAFTCFLVIPVFAAGIISMMLSVIKIICFFQICSGKAKEPAIIRSLKFLK